MVFFEGCYIVYKMDYYSKNDEYPISLSAGFAFSLSLRNNRNIRYQKVLIY